MQVFFGGSIRGGRDDADVYAAIIDILDDHADVLTEHVGRSVEAAGAGPTDAEIHDRDLTRLREADAVVSEVTTPSLGVGYEVGRAVEWGKPVCCLYRSGGDHALSAMIRGNEAVTVEAYGSPADLEPTLTAFLDRHR
jgi:hypothetical protein